MLAVATGIQASDFVVDELCYNITDAEAKPSKWRSMTIR